ncbi:TetR/AcrR family transcriptional regulator [Streptomyces sp. NPDC001739]
MEAARTAVAEVSVGVSAHEIARRAGVGIGTFYRRIPSLEALLEVVLEDLLDQISDAAGQALEDPDPWHGLCAFATVYVRLRAESCGISEALGGAFGNALAQRIEDLREGMRALVERAQATGAVRTDLAWQDVPFLFAAAATTRRTLCLDANAQQWERNLRVILDGLRPVPSGLSRGQPA